MKDDKTFKLTDVGLQQAGKAILLTWLPFVVGLCGSFAYDLLINPQSRTIFFHLRNAFIFAFIVYGLMQIFNKKRVKDSAKVVLFKILNGMLSIEVDNEIVFSGSLNDLKAIRTLDPANKKNTIQCQIYVGDVIISLASNLNFVNKLNFDDFTKYCEMHLHMVIKPVPFSIYTSNFQGIKYLEYYNPKNPLITK